MLMVIYLTVVGYHDRKFENNYYAHAQEWESSGLCTAIGVLAVISSEVCILQDFSYMNRPISVGNIIITSVLVNSSAEHLIWIEPDWSQSNKTLTIRIIWIAMSNNRSG